MSHNLPNYPDSLLNISLLEESTETMFIYLPCNGIPFAFSTQTLLLLSARGILGCPLPLMIEVYFLTWIRWEIRSRIHSRRLSVAKCYFCFLLKHSHQSVVFRALESPFSWSTWNLRPLKTFMVFLACFLKRMFLKKFASKIKNKR